MTGYWIALMPLLAFTGLAIVTLAVAWLVSKTDFLGSNEE
jgi:hypothetical protein